MRLSFLIVVINKLVVHGFKISTLVIKNNVFKLFNSELENSDSSLGSKLKRPPIIPYDFAREDIKAPTKISEPIKQPTPPVNETKKIPTTKLPEFNDDNARPTGYNNKDEDDEIDATPYVNDDDSEIVKLFKGVFIGSIYDSPKKQQARFVIRSITVISFAIGLIFTGIWYTFPGKFVNIRKDYDISAKYATSYIDPNDLLGTEFDKNNGEYFDDALGLPEKEITRFAPKVNEPIRAPGNTLDL
jgi:hypothetical protein